MTVLQFRSIDPGLQRQILDRTDDKLHALQDWVSGWSQYSGMIEIYKDLQNIQEKLRKLRVKAK